MNSLANGKWETMQCTLLALVNTVFQFIILSNFFVRCEPKADAPPMAAPPLEDPQCNKEFDTGECTCSIMIDTDNCFVNCLDQIDAKKYYNVSSKTINFSLIIAESWTP